MDRFFRYVKIDTQSAEDQNTVPSTRKQLNLANLLAKELTELGAQGVRVSEFGIVYAVVPGNLPDNSKVPVVGFIAHMDTSPAVSGANVTPVVHKNYQGGDIVLPKDPTQVITVADNPVLKDLIGDDIITADGTTLLGSDDKAGVAEITRQRGGKFQPGAGRIAGADHRNHRPHQHRRHAAHAKQGRGIVEFRQP